eukprot:gnl/MRDRNA2_/MRDRNA2_88619_c0_seq1.p1 gnl/MRDRNA2_/MRDRNA2_88619_c0~~gnl/MRDRNA2_/MRDRNA2_88619_c0_seq1.p1  ORF type:complete len:107 (-),score=29.28 gnl/MRDRNA2_/MRDRNA2_88619_c0_seq1:153-473(-)
MAAHKVNAKYFAQTPAGALVHIAGQMSEDKVLQATDGQRVDLSSGQTSPDLCARSGFVELVGKKDGAGLIVEEIRNLGDTLDFELWNNAIEMRHHPELKQFFNPTC